MIQGSTDIFEIAKVRQSPETLVVHRVSDRPQQVALRIAMIDVDVYTLFSIDGHHNPDGFICANFPEARHQPYAYNVEFNQKCARNQAFCRPSGLTVGELGANCRVFLGVVGWLPPQNARGLSIGNTSPRCSR